MWKGTGDILPSTICWAAITPSSNDPLQSNFWEVGKESVAVISGLDGICVYIYLSIYLYVCVCVCTRVFSGAESQGMPLLPYAQEMEASVPAE